MKKESVVGSSGNNQKEGERTLLRLLCMYAGPKGPLALVITD